MNFCWVPRSITFHSVTCFPHLKNGPVSDLRGVSVSYRLLASDALGSSGSLSGGYSFFRFENPALPDMQVVLSDP